MVFHSENERLAGNGGCNTFFGNYALNGDKLGFSAMGSTMMACPEGVESEQSFQLPWVTLVTRHSKYCIYLQYVCAQPTHTRLR